jgi:sugar lactone lactonase YvrE
MARLPMLVLAAALAALVAGTAAARPFPDVIALPDGFRPEGISVGAGHTFYVGSIPTGAIYRGDLRTGEGDVLVPAQDGRAAIGTEVDELGRIFVAGGPTGDAYVYDAETGAALAAYDLSQGAPATFVNDLVVTKDAVWLTDSRRAVLYRLPLGQGGALPEQEDVETMLLTTESALGPPMLNGIEATPDGTTLIGVQSSPGLLWRIDPSTGVAAVIELTGGDGNVEFGDGLLLDGGTLYVVQNRKNKIAVVELANDLGSGTIVGYIEDSDFDVPTTIAEHGDRLYAVNARFGTPDPDGASYSVVQVQKQ